jgi:hypothetical protein
MKPALLQVYTPKHVTTSWLFVTFDDSASHGRKIAMSERKVAD